MEWYARDSDGTVVFTLAQRASGGSLWTVEFAKKHGKPCLQLSQTGYYPCVTLQEFVEDHGIKVLNVAGSRETKEPGIWRWAYQVVEDAFF